MVRGQISPPLLIGLAVQSVSAGQSDADLHAAFEYYRANVAQHVDVALSEGQSITVRYYDAPWLEFELKPDIDYANEDGVCGLQECLRAHTLNADKAGLARKPKRSRCR